MSERHKVRQFLAHASGYPPKHWSQDQFFKERDRNGGGVLTLEEYIGTGKRPIIIAFRMTLR